MCRPDEHAFAPLGKSRLFCSSCGHVLDLLAKSVQPRARSPRARRPRVPEQRDLFTPEPTADDLEAEIAGIVRDAQRNGDEAERVMERIVTAASLRNEQEPPRRVPVEPDDSFGVTGI